MPDNAKSPLSGTAPNSVPLPQTPLTGVLAQIRFPEVFSVAKKEFVADFQELIRGEYPRSQEEQSVIIKVGVGGADQRTTPNWRFFDAAMQWRISLTTEFVSIETRAYKDRKDFADRIGRILEAVARTIEPSGAVRIGVRFVDRIPSELLSSLDRYVHPQILGFSDPAHQSELERSMHESLFNVEEGKLLARWGMMPGQQSHDPEMLPPIDDRSWFLDTDVFQEFDEMLAFDAKDLQARSYQLASRAYAFFRAVTTEELLSVYGGEV